MQRRKRPSLSTNLIVPVAHFVPCTEAEGPGKRFALWFQGCPLRCPGCCNPEMLPFEGGKPMALPEILERIFKAHKEQGIEGITLLGGEPLAHAAAGTEIARAAREGGLSVMVFSGYTLEEAQELPDPAVAELLSLTDILVDGRYERHLPDTQRRWIGSTNQRIHFLTDRYRADDPCWKKKNTLEIRLDAKGLALNGFPAQIAVGLWKDLPRKSKKE
jgi:anaerobic ribonucleoside-triphosphate reductase activating protein